MSKYPIARNCILSSGLLILFLTLASLLINYFFLHFKGNNYLPDGAYSLGFALVFILGGLRLHPGRNSYLYEMVQTIFILYIVLGAIAWLTNAAQFTPFNPIDKYIIAFEHSLHIDMSSIVAWTIRHHWLQQTLVIIYDSLPSQMSIIPIVLAIFGQFTKLREYFCLMLVSAIIGFTFYYFFPTIAPASSIESPYFSPEQHATGIKFSEIHHYLSPSTMDGGMIALPSFHVIWAWFCVYLLRDWVLPFYLLLFINSLLTVACVLLGWHYLTDIVGSLIVILITHAISRPHNNAPSTKFSSE